MSPINLLNFEKFWDSAKLNSALLKSRVYALLLTLLTPPSILNAIVSQSLKLRILLNLSLPITSSFVSSRSGNLNPWLTHLASILGSYVWQPLETSWLVGMPLCCLSKKVSGTFKFLIRTRACHLKTSSRCLKRGVFPFFTLSERLVTKSYHNMTFTDFSDPDLHSQWDFCPVHRGAPDIEPFLWRLCSSSSLPVFTQNPVINHYETYIWLQELSHQVSYPNSVVVQHL